MVPCIIISDVSDVVGHLWDIICLKLVKKSRDFNWKDVYLFRRMRNRTDTII